ncbi:MAG: molybdenum cofactor guanylyltransferase [Ferruginibacter sp.]
MPGVILCGGESKRMGTDKGLIQLQATTWAQTAVNKIGVLKIPVVLSVNHTQFNDYSVVFDPSDLITDEPSLNIGGPLCGLLSVHMRYPCEDLFILACDLPVMEATIIYQLAESYRQNQNYDAFVFSNRNEPEPLCAIYSSKGLQHTLQLYQS